MSADDATALLRAFAAGTRSPVDAVKASQHALDTTGAGLNVAITTLPSSAAAADSERRWAEGRPRALEGIPIGVKDIIAVAGMQMTGGSRLLAGHVPDHDAAVIERLRAAGAIVVAKLATFAFANGDPINADFGVTRNPHDPHRLAGGSSSGSAAAVGAGCVPVALGTDTGGSIRLPASYCGVAGLKPTFGRVSRYGVLPLAWTLDHVGPISRTARDLRLMLEVLSGADARDPAMVETPAVPGTLSSLEGLRVGVPDSYFVDDLDHPTAAAFDAALRTLTTAGARLVTVHIDDLHLMEPVGRTIITAEAASAHEAFADRLADYDDLLGARLAAAPLVRATDYLKALRLRVALQRNLSSAFETCDVIATPTTPTVAPPIDTLQVELARGSVPWLEVAARNTFPFNIAGLPTATVPIPGQALPVGLQLSAPLHRDELTLDVAELFEARLGG